MTDRKLASLADIQHDFQKKDLECLMWLAQYFSPIKYSEIPYGIQYTLNLTTIKFKTLVVNAKNKGWIYVISADGDDKETIYALAPNYHLYLLWLLCTEYYAKKIEWERQFLWSRNGYYNDFFNELYNYFQGKTKVNTLAMFQLNSMPIVNLVHIFPQYKETNSLYTGLSSDEIAIILDVNNKHIAYNLLPDIILPTLEEQYLHHPNLDIHCQKLFTEMFDMYHNIWSGNMLKNKNVVTNIGAVQNAIIEAYTGDTQVAKLIFQKSIQMANKYNKSRLVIFTNLFESFVYAMCCYRDEQADNEQNINNILRSKQLKENDWISIRLLLLERLGRMSEITKILERGTEPESPLGSVLLILVYKNLNLHQYAGKAVNLWDNIISQLAAMLTTAIAHSPYLQLLKLEMAYAYKGEVDNKLQIKSLFDYRTHSSEWQLLLKRMTIGLAQTAKPKSNGEFARIIYLYNSDMGISARLQKSRDGIAWTKGRTVALTTFKKGVEGMDDIDRRVAMQIRVTSSYYGKQDCELNVFNALEILCGANRLFLEERPEVPVDIRYEKPMVMVKKEEQGFHITTWPKNIAKGEHITEESFDRLVLTRISDDQSSLLKSLQTTQIFPPEAEEELRSFLVILSEYITVHSDLLSAAFENREVSNKLTLQLLPLNEELIARLYAKPFEDIPPYCTPGEGIVEITGKIGNETFVGKRDLKQESKLRKQIDDTLVLFQDTEGENGFRAIGNEQALEFLDTVKGLDNVVRMEWPQGIKYHIRKNIEFTDLKLKLSRKNNWFEMSGSVLLTDEVKMELRELIERMDNSRFVSVGENEYLALSSKLHKQLKQIKAMTDVGKKQMKLPTVSLLRLNRLQEAGTDISGDKAYKDIRRKMIDAEKQLFTTPSTLAASLRDYQTEGFEWMARLTQWGAGCCLADDMGLGKTIQTITLLLYRAQEGAALIIAPASVVRNWQRELARFAPTLHIYILNDSNREHCINDAKAGDVVITTYGLLTTEEERLSKKDWAVIVADEAHVVKNRNTKMSKSLMMLTANTRIALTGTPLQNNLSEIWNLFEFINPGLLGTFNAFTERFIRPIEQDNDSERQKMLKRLLSPFILRRTKNEVLEELPTKTEIVHKIVLNSTERKHYELLRSKAEHEAMGESNNKFAIMAQIARLRQAACDLRLVDTSLNTDGSKVEQLMELVTELHENGHSALIFSQYTSMLELVQKRLKSEQMTYLYLDGSTPIKTREELVNRFQAGESSLFLISLKAGGVGLNLTQADYVIHLDPWWNPAVEDQATDRIYRIGQQRPVTVYRLITEGTIEEKILELHSTKRNLADALLEGSNMNHKISADELLKLLKEE